MKKLIRTFYSECICLSLLIFTGVGFSDPSDSLWTKTYGGPGDDEAFCVRETHDDGFILVGYATKGSGAQDVFVIKTNALGDTVWTRTYGGPFNDVGWNIIQTNDYGYIVVGESERNASQKDVFIIKLDANGDSVWTKTYSGNKIDFGTNIIQLPDNGYIISAVTSSFGSGSFDWWLIRTDVNGDTIWTRTFGGPGYDDCWSIVQNEDKGFAILGRVEPDISSFPDIWLIKTDSIGNIDWTQTYGGDESEYGGSIDTTKDGGFILTGFTSSYGNGASDLWLVRTDYKGDTLWTKTFGGGNSEIGESGITIPEGGYVLCGGSKSFGMGDWDIYIVKTDSSGNPVWSKNLGGSYNDFANSVIRLQNGFYLLAGSTFSYEGGSDDIILMKIDSLGNSAPSTGIKNKNVLLAGGYRLYQNYPNPFNFSTGIEFYLPVTARVHVKIYDSSGRQITGLFNRQLQPGNHKIIWNAKDIAGNRLSSGVYIYQLKIDGRHVISKKMLLLK